MESAVVRCEVKLLVRHRNRENICIGRKMMFTQGLDENAVEWIRQSDDVIVLRSPSSEKMMSDSPSCHSHSKSRLPPPRLSLYSSGLGLLLRTTLRDQDEDEDQGTVDSTYSSYQQEEGFNYHLPPPALTSKPDLHIQTPPGLLREFSITDSGTPPPSAPPISVYASPSQQQQEEEAPKCVATNTTRRILQPSSSSITTDHSLYNPTISVQNAWQTMIAYDACIRLCLHAWARGCTQAPHFLHHQCFLLTAAFGLHKYLLQPRDVYQREGTSTQTAHESCAVKPVGKIKVQETLSCSFQLKSSNEEPYTEPSSPVCLQPGTGDYHIFFPESQGDALLMEVQDMNRFTQGRASIPVSSLNDNPIDRVRWCDIYDEDHECVGKVQLFISSMISCNETHSTKSAKVVETLAYDLVLESAMRAQHFQACKLQLDGPWNWLLSEFAEFYGVSDSYTKLRYLSHVMNVATPTMDCLQTVYELLVPILKAKNDRSLTRQEKSLLLDCETQVESLLAKVFENYKSLDELSPTGLTDILGQTSDSTSPALLSAVQVYTLLHDILAPEAQTVLRNYLQRAALQRCKRHMVETDEFVSSNTNDSLTDPITISTAYLKMKNLCTSISNEIEADIKIHNQHILPSSIDLSKIAAEVYTSELCKRLKSFLATWPPSTPLPHVTDLLTTTADLERNLELWNIRPTNGGVDSRSLFHDYIMVWVEDMQMNLFELCKAEKVPWSGVTTNHATSPFAENMYEKIKDALNEYEVVINRWPQYSLVLENAVTNIERAILKALEKQYNDILTPLKDTIPKKLGMHVQKFARRQSMTLYSIPNHLGVFLNTIKRILDVLHCRVEQILQRWAPCLPVVENKRSLLGEHLNGVSVLLRTKYKTYMLEIVEKLVSNMQGSRLTRLKRILEETKEVDGEAEVRERMQPVSSQLMDTITNLHEVFSAHIFLAICRGFWDRMGQIVLKFLENRKENRVWYKGSYYALGILDDTFASQMQRLQGNVLQDKDMEPPPSVVEARSILSKDRPNKEDSSTYLYF